jgi:hypothetical protein
VILSVAVGPTLALGQAGGDKSASGTSLEALRHLVEKQQAAQEKFEQALDTPAATDARQKSQTAYQSLGDGEAQGLFTRTFADFVNRQAQLPVRPAQVKGYLDDHTAVVEKAPAEQDGSNASTDGIPTVEDSPAQPSSKEDDGDVGGPGAGLVGSIMTLRTL